MAELHTVERVRTDLRISHFLLDSDISDNIDSCIKDLESCGVVVDERDPLIFAAIKTYCRAQFEDDPTSSQKWEEAYGRQKAHLQMSEGYGL